MPERRVTVGSRVGLHARPASLFCQAAARLNVPVVLTSAEGRSTLAASVVGVLSLKVAAGEEVVLSAEGDNVEIALDQLASLLGSDLDEQ